MVLNIIIQVTTLNVTIFYKSLNKSLKKLSHWINRVRGLNGLYRESQKVNRSPKFVRLHMGHLIGPSIKQRYDFCRIKNLKFAFPPALPHK